MASGHEWKRPTAANHASPRRSRGKKLIAVTVSLHLLVPFISSSELVVSQHLQGEGGNLAIKFRLKLSFYLWMHPTWKTCLQPVALWFCQASQTTLRGACWAPERDLWRNTRGFKGCRQPQGLCCHWRVYRKQLLCFGGFFLLTRDSQ